MRRRREHLIPPEKRKRIIYLERRGAEKKRPVGAGIFAVLSLACLLYCVSIFLFMGYGTKFFLIWGAMSIFFAALAILLAHRDWLEKIPRWFRISFTVLFIIGVLFFMTVEGMIFSQFSAKAQPGADYVIVLGAQWKQNGPSYVLQKRLVEAVEYLQENPDTKVIVSGGQGANEPMSEAQGMKSYLTQAGIEEERILVEDQSTNTYENLIYSAKLLNQENDSVVLVTNNFHMFRALQIAQKQGYVHIEGQSAASYPAMMPNNLLREFFGVVKDFMVGNL